ncbi:hypothetical protein WAI453_000621 [Rhynchosporium graminicola]
MEGRAPPKYTGRTIITILFKISYFKFELLFNHYTPSLHLPESQTLAANPANRPKMPRSKNERRYVKPDPPSNVQLAPPSCSASGVNGFVPLLEFSLL